MMFLKIIASVVLILLVVLLASKLIVRIIWFLFPYSSFSLKLRAVVVGQLLARHLALGSESPCFYRNRFGRDCVRITHDEYGGMGSGDIGYITEKLFGILANGLAKNFGYTRGVVFIENDASVFQFWNTDS